MMLMRPALIGCVAAVLAIVFSATLPFVVVRQVVSGTSFEPAKPGAVLSREELDARTRQAEAELDLARARVKELGTWRMLRSEIASYFAIFGPAFVLGAGLLRRQAHRKELLVLPVPAFVAMCLLGLEYHGLALLAAACMLALLLRQSTFAKCASDA